jgi:biotin carboxyl carrier protein
MPGTVIAVNVTAGDDVAANDATMVITSMKMEITLRAPRTGRVAAVHVGVGGNFERDAVLVTLEPEA